MLDLDERVVVRGDPDQRPAHQRGPVEVERPACLGRDQAGQGGLALARRQILEREHRQPHGPRLAHELRRPAGDPLEARAQHLVPAHDLRQRALQGPHVQLAVEADDQLEVVREVVGDQLVEEPDQLLRIRERRRSVLPLHGRGSGGDGRGGPGPAHPPGRLRMRLRDQRRLIGQHRRRVQRGDRHRLAKPVPQPGRQLDRADRVAPGREEVVGRADPPARPQHLLPERREAPLQRAGRRDVVRLLAGGCERAQRPHVHLVAGRPGQRRKDVDGRRDQVLRQALAQRGAELLGGDPTLAGRGEAGQPRRARRLVDDHHGGVPHGRMPAQGGLDLAGLDAEAADLDLLIGPAEELYRPVRAPPHAVAGAVQASRPMGVGQEPLRRQARPVEVAAGEAGTAQVQLTGRAGGDRLQRPVEHVRPDPRERPADRRRSLLTGRAAVGERVDRGLGRPVEVEQPAARRPRAHDLAGDGLGTGGHHAHVGQRLRVEDRQRGRRHEQRGHPLPAQHLDQARSGQPLLRAADVEGRAGRQGQERLQQRGVEAPGGELEHAVAGPDSRPLDRVGEQVTGAPVRDGHAVRPAGRARGVDDVGQVVRVGGGQLGGRRRRLAAVQAHDLGARHVERVAPCALGEQHGHPGVRGQRPQAAVGQAGVERHERGAGPEHGEEGHHQLRRARQVHADPHLAAGAGRAQPARQRPGAPLDLAVGERLTARGQERRSRRRRARPRLERRVQGGRHVLPGRRPVPLDQDAAALAGVQDRQLRQAAAGVGGHGAEQPLQGGGQPAGRLRLQPVDE